MKILVVGGTGSVSGAIVAGLVGPGRQVFMCTDGKGAISPPQGVHAHLVADRNDLSASKSSIEGTGVTEWDAVVDAVGFDESQARNLLEIVRNRARHIFIISTTFVYSPRAPLPLTSNSAVGSRRELGGYASCKLRME